MQLHNFQLKCNVWIGPVFPSTSLLVTLKNKDIKSCDRIWGERDCFLEDFTKFSQNSFYPFKIIGVLKGIKLIEKISKCLGIK